MEHLHGWFLAAAYAAFTLVLVVDAILPWIKLKSLLRSIVLRDRRHPPSERTITP